MSFSRFSPAPYPNVSPEGFPPGGPVGTGARLLPGGPPGEGDLEVALGRAALATSQRAVPVTVIPNFTWTASGASSRARSSTTRAAAMAGPVAAADHGTALGSGVLIDQRRGPTCWHVIDGRVAAGPRSTSGSPRARWPST